MKKKYDIVIVGNGVAGLFAALHLPKDKEIAIITKGSMEECDSYLAQGGICVLKNADDYEYFVENCRKTEFYNTGVVGTHKDKYITLSTCEYSQKNGRMIVIGKLI